MELLRSPDLLDNGLESLIPEMHERVSRLIKACKAKNLKVVPFATRRGPKIQGKLWCQSRSYFEVLAMRNILEGAHAKVLASFLRTEWVSTGRWATNLLPGQSWHQWGEACDCFIEVGGKSTWTDGRYSELYGKLALDQGLEAGALWPGRKDFYHVQLRKEQTPNSVNGGLSWYEIQEAMCRFYDLQHL